MNKLFAIGKVYRKNLKYTKDSKPIMEFTLRDSVKKGDEWTSEFFTCVLFGKSAEFFNLRVQEKQKVFIEAVQSTSSYEKDGRKINVKNWYVNTFRLLEDTPKDDYSTVNNQENSEDVYTEYDQTEIPF